MEDATMNQRTFIGLVNFLLVLTFALFQAPAYGITGGADSETPLDAPLYDEAASRYTIRPADRAPDDPTPLTPEFAPGRMIVKLKDNASFSDLEALNQQFGVTSMERIFPDAPDFQERLKALKAKRASLDNPTHTSWYWWQDKDSQEAKEYQARLESEKQLLDTQIQTLQNRITRRQQRSTASADLKDVYLLKMDEFSNIPEAQKAYSAHPAVAYAEPDSIVEVQLFPDTLPDDLYVDPDQDGTWSQGTWDQSYPDLYGTKLLQTHQAWPITQGEGIIVAVIDTGVDRTHEDLADNMWVNANETPGNGIDDDNNGFVDDVHGWDFSNMDNDPTDGHGHGTHCSGTIAAVGNNALGIIGIAPRAQIMAVKGLSDGGSGYASGLAQCVYYAVNNGAHILSNSWGGRGSIQVLTDAFHYAYDNGVVAIAAAGNSSSDFMGFKPANIDTVISVAAMDYTDTMAYFSNWGEVDIAAPGVDVLSARASGTSMGRTVDAAYTRASGTSMACPHTAGVAALIASRMPVMSPETLKLILLATADPLPLVPGNNKLQCGRANAYRGADFNMEQLCYSGIASPARREVLKNPDAVEIRGVAYGDGFSHYLLDYAVDSDAHNWISILDEPDPESTNPKDTEGVLGIWDAAHLTDGAYTLRLRVLNNAQPPNTFAYKVRLEINNAAIVQPIEGAFLRNDADLQITGTACGVGFQSYSIELYNCQERSWSTEGIELADNGTVPKTGTGDLLGTLNTSAISEAGRYELRLTIYYANRTQTAEQYFYVDPDLKPGFPIKFPDVTRWLHTVINVAPVKTNQGERLALSFQSKVLIVEPDGTFSQMDPEIPPYGVPSYYRYLSVADLDGDGNEELITNLAIEKVDRDKQFCPRKFRTYAFRADGTLLPEWRENWLDRMQDGGIYSGMGYLGRTVPAIADVDSDGDLDVAFQGFTGKYRSTDYTNPDWRTTYYGTQRFYLLDTDGDFYDADGDNDPEWPIQIKELTDNHIYQLYAMSMQHPAVADLNGDGILEFLSWNNYEGLVCYEPDGTLLWNTNQPEPSEDWYRLVSPPVVANIDNDPAGTLEVILGGPDGKLYVFDHEGNLKVLAETPYPQCSIPYVAVADFEKDDIPEIICMVGNGNATGVMLVFQYDPDSNRLDLLSTVKNYSYSIGHHGRKNPIIGDADGDGTPEIIIMSYKGIKAFAHTGELLWERMMWGVKPPNGDLVTPVLVDLDSDGKMELVGCSTLKGSSMYSMDIYLFVWDLDSLATPENMPWPVFRGNRRNTGCYAPHAPSNDDPPPSNDPPSFTNLPADREVDENALLAYTVAADDPDGDALRYAAVDPLPSGAVFSGDTLTWTPDYDQSGSYSVTFSVTDNNNPAVEGTLSITVVNVNRDPTLDPIGGQTLDEGQTREVPLNATDPDGDTITLSGDSLPAFVTLEDHGDGTGRLLLAPEAGHNGTYDCAIEATDEHGAQTTQAFSMRVEVPTAPPPGEHWPVGPITQAQATDITFTWPAYHDADGNPVDTYLIVCRPVRSGDGSFYAKVVTGTEYTRTGTLNCGVYYWSIYHARGNGRWGIIRPVQRNNFTVLYDGPGTGPTGFEPASTIQEPRPIFRWDLEVGGYPFPLVPRGQIRVFTRAGEPYTANHVTLSNGRAVLRRDFEPGQYMWFMAYRSSARKSYTDWAYFTVE